MASGNLLDAWDYSLVLPISANMLVLWVSDLHTQSHLIVIICLSQWLPGNYSFVPRARLAPHWNPHVTPSCLGKLCYQ